MFRPMNRLLAGLFRGRASRKRNNRRNRALFRECLESRALMAADISIAGGVITINADPAGTNAIVFDPNPASNVALIQVTTTSPNGNVNRLIAKNGITSIRFNGSDHADQFSNVSAYRSLAYGYGGNDVLNGGSNADTLWGQNGDDTLRGVAGDDFLYGGNNDDVLEGGTGVDTLYGQNGNDHLLGGLGDDVLYGGAGMDGLFGDSGLDTYNGGTGGDRFLNDTSEGHQYFADFNSDDVQIHFSPAPYKSFDINGTLTNWGAGQWSGQDILQMDKAFEVLARRTGNNVLLVDVDGAELTYFRHSVYSDDNPNSSYAAYNHGGDMYFANSVFSSEDNVLRIVAHEIAHNWDSAEEMDIRLPGQGDTIIGGFRSISGWVHSPLPGFVIDVYDVSLDDEWSYLSSATFARNYGKTNPSEDFSTVIEEYIMDFDDRVDGGLSDIPAKIISQHVWLNKLSEIQFNNAMVVGLRDAQGLLPGRTLSLDGEEIPDVPVLSHANGVATLQGTDINDFASVNYVFGPGGGISMMPTQWVRIQASNANGIAMGDFPAGIVQRVDFNAEAGNDTFSNQTFINSIAYGGLGNDLLNGGNATDRLFGGIGIDHLNGGNGNDVLSGDQGDDLLSGGAGEDFMVGGDGHDSMQGGTGDDHLIGRNGNDWLRGDAGNDILEGNDGADNLSGGDGRDILVGGLGSDLLQGGNGEDLLVGGQLAFTNNHVALSEIWSEWNSNHDYATRVRNIIGTPHPNFAQRLNKDSFLVLDKTVLDDGEVDTLLGQGDRDAFFGELGLDVSDRLPIEFELS
ncbi:MAG: calcium-binding protein [Pirellula sp.]